MIEDDEEASKKHAETEQYFNDQNAIVDDTRMQSYIWLTLAGLFWVGGVSHAFMKRKRRSRINVMSEVKTEEQQHLNLYNGSVIEMEDRRPKTQFTWGVRPYIDPQDQRKTGSLSLDLRWEF